MDAGGIGRFILKLYINFVICKNLLKPNKYIEYGI